MPDYRFMISLHDHLELDYHDRKDEHIGRLRLKESTIQWRSPNAKKYRSVSLARFIEWIESPESGSALAKF
jgi:hypothetical protein